MLLQVGYLLFYPIFGLRQLRKTRVFYADENNSFMTVCRLGFGKNPMASRCHFELELESDKSINHDIFNTSEWFIVQTQNQDKSDDLCFQLLFGIRFVFIYFLYFFRFCTILVIYYGLHIYSGYSSKKTTRIGFHIITPPSYFKIETQIKMFVCKFYPKGIFQRNYDNFQRNYVEVRFFTFRSKDKYKEFEINYKHLTMDVIQLSREVSNQDKWYYHIDMCDGNSRWTVVKNDDSVQSLLQKDIKSDLLNILTEQKYENFLDLLTTLLMYVYDERILKSQKMDNSHYSIEKMLKSPNMDNINNNIETFLRDHDELPSEMTSKNKYTLLYVNPPPPFIYKDITFTNERYKISKKILNYEIQGYGFVLKKHRNDKNHMIVDVTADIQTESMIRISGYYGHIEQLDLQSDAPFTRYFPIDLFTELDYLENQRRYVTQIYHTQFEVNCDEVETPQNNNNNNIDRKPLQQCKVKPQSNDVFVLELQAKAGIGMLFISAGFLALGIVFILLNRMK